jgi:hypothetical protein
MIENKDFEDEIQFTSNHPDSKYHATELFHFSAFSLFAFSSSSDR